MANKGQMTGMLGVYLVAAELSKQGFIVSPTSRSAAGADLLVTDQAFRKAWSVQVKTNSGRPNFWLVGAHARNMRSGSHMYVFVNNARGEKPEFLVAPSSYVADKIVYQKASKGSEWYSFSLADRPMEDEGWELFGDPNPDPHVTAALEAESQDEPHLNHESELETHLSQQERSGISEEAIRNDVKRTQAGATPQ